MEGSRLQRSYNAYQPNHCAFFAKTSALMDLWIWKTKNVIWNSGILEKEPNSHSGVGKDNEKEKDERSGGSLLAGLCVNNQRDRAVVDEGNLHHGGEPSGGDGAAEGGGH